MLKKGLANQMMTIPGNLGVSYVVTKNLSGEVAGAGVLGASPLCAGCQLITFAAADVDEVGALTVLTLDGGGNQVGGWLDFVVDPCVWDAAGLRAALGLAAANLDTQLGGLTPMTAIALRAALGLAAANLDTQLSGIGSISPVAIRAALGLAAANLDTQLANLVATQPGPVNLTNTALQSIITAVGTGIPIPVVIAPPSVFPWHN